MKKLIKQVIVSLCLAIGIIAGLCGCANESTSKKFEKAGLTITLTTEFYEFVTFPNQSLTIPMPQFSTL